jgi:hypothetical protein
MERLRRLIGSAPSERSKDDLLAFVRARQAAVANVLQEFRTRMEGRTTAKVRAQGPKASDANLGELLKQMKESGLTMEDLKRMKGRTQ